MRITVSYDIRVAGIIEVVADNEEEAELQVMELDKAYLIKLADAQTAEVIIDGTEVHSLT